MNFRNFFKKRESTQDISMPVNENTETVTEFKEILVNQIPELDLSEERPEYLLHSPEVVGWMTNEEQRLLFSILVFLYSPEDSILDVGCGRGDLYGFLQEKYPGLYINYRGIDINPNMINISKQKYTGINTECIHLLDDSNLDTYSWILASGIFNLKDSFHLDGFNDIENITEYMKECIDEMYERSTIGVGFNLLTSLPDDISDEDKDALIVHDSGMWLKYLIDTYANVIVRADYLNGDVTFFILK